MCMFVYVYACAGNFTVRVGVRSSFRVRARIKPRVTVAVTV